MSQLDSSRTVALVTLGCARNDVDSEELAARLAEGGWTLTEDAQSADAVLVNTAIAAAADPVAMGLAFKLAVEAGRLGYEAGLAGRSAKTAPEAHGTSPLTAFLSGV